MVQELVDPAIIGVFLQALLSPCVCNAGTSRLIFQVPRHKYGDFVFRSISCEMNAVLKTQIRQLAGQRRDEQCSRGKGLEDSHVGISGKIIPANIYNHTGASIDLGHFF